jgi:membrane protease YdiL (CAAX protease family)
LPIGIVAVAFQRFVHREKIADLGYKACSFRELGTAVVLPALIIFLILLVDWMLGFVSAMDSIPLRNSFSRTPEIVDGWSLLLIVVVNALITFIACLATEEVAFRGYILTKLRKLGDSRALLLSSLLFGIWHYPVSLILWDAGVLRSTLYVFNISLVGVLFGYQFLRSNSLLTCSLSHGVWNALAYTLFGLSNTKGLFSGDSKAIYDPEEGMVGTVVLLIFVSFVLLKQRKNLIHPNDSSCALNLDEKKGIQS